MSAFIFEYVTDEVHRQVAEQLLDEGAEVVSFGETRVQKMGGSMYGLIPHPLPKTEGFEKGTGIEVLYHPGSESVIITKAESE